MIRVVLADDHASVRDGLRHIIDGQPDMTVIGEAASGAEALEQAGRLQPDVLVLDLTMPGMGGLQATQAIRTLTVPAGRNAIVILTRHDDPAFVRRALDAGALGYVLKQSRSSELLQAIRIAASGATYLDAALTPAAATTDARPDEHGPEVTRRENEVLRLVAAGHSNKEIAASLGITVKTVEVHKANAMRKLALRGRIDVVRYAILHGWLDDV